MPEYLLTKDGNYQKMSSTGTIESRKHYRHPVHWRIALVHKHSDKNEIYHGKTHDLSVTGASILVDQNIFIASEVVILLAIPPLHAGQKETIIEIQCSMAYTVLDNEQSQFRIGISFVHFKGEGKRILLNTLSKRALPKNTKKSYVVM